MHRLKINLGSILWNFLSYIGCLKKEELCFCCHSWNRIVPAPLDKGSIGMIFHPVPLKHLLWTPVTDVAQSQSCPAWMLQLSAAHLWGPVLCQLFRASQPAQAARNTALHLQLQIAHISSGASCPCRLSSILILPISPMTSELLWSPQSSTAGSDLAWSSRSLLLESLHLRFISPVVSVDFSKCP